MRFLIFLFFIGCSSYPKYEAHFSERKIDKELISVKYTGNHDTKLEVTSLYSAFRALEYCSEKSRPLTILIEQSAEGKSVSTVFMCAEKSQMLNLHVRTFDEIRLLTKDGKGGIEIAIVPDDSPNKNSVKNGDFLISINNERVENLAKMTEVVNELKSEAKATIYRNGTELTVVLKTDDNTQQHVKRNQDALRRACRFPELANRPLCKKLKNHQ